MRRQIPKNRQKVSSNSPLIFLSERWGKVEFIPVRNLLMEVGWKSRKTKMAAVMKHKLDALKQKMKGHDFIRGTSLSMDAIL